VIGFPPELPAVASCGGAVGALSQLVDCGRLRKRVQGRLRHVPAVPASLRIRRAAGGGADVRTLRAAASQRDDESVPTKTATPPERSMDADPHRDAGADSGDRSPDVDAHGDGDAHATVVVTPPSTRPRRRRRPDGDTGGHTDALGDADDLAHADADAVGDTHAHRTATPTVSPTVTPVPAAVRATASLNTARIATTAIRTTATSCPTSCHRAPVGCPTAGRFAQQLHDCAPVARVLGWRVLPHLSTNVSLPGSGSVGGRVTGLSGGLPVLNDFNNGGALSFVANPSAQEFNRRSASICARAATPRRRASSAREASEDQGIEIDPTTIQSSPRRLPHPA